MFCFLCAPICFQISDHRSDFRLIFFSHFFQVLRSIERLTYGVRANSVTLLPPIRQVVYSFFYSENLRRKEELLLWSKSSCRFSRLYQIAQRSRTERQLRSIQSCFAKKHRRLWTTQWQVSSSGAWISLLLFLLTSWFLQWIHGHHTSDDSSKGVVRWFVTDIFA